MVPRPAIDGFATKLRQAAAGRRCRSGREEIGSAMANGVAAAKGVVALGASAGGVEALGALAASLPPDFPFAVMAVLHMTPKAPSVLAQILDRAGPLPAVTAKDGAVLEAGHIYVGVPNRHLLLRDHRIVLSDGPWENGQRPAIDALFRSVALDYGQHAIGVLMSGLLNDGVAGLEAIRGFGGITIVQEPDDALYPDLPLHALKAGVVDHVATAREIGGMLKKLADRDVEEPEMDPDGRLELENQIAMGRRFAISADTEELGPPTGYTCPNCKGALCAVRPGSYRCSVGHAWTAEALLLAYDEEFEETVWAAIRLLKDNATLSRQLADSAGSEADRERYAARAAQAEHVITLLDQAFSEATKLSAATKSVTEDT